jgi:hypothetical protein
MHLQGAPVERLPDQVGIRNKEVRAVWIERLFLQGRTFPLPRSYCGNVPHCLRGQWAVRKERFLCEQS